jgi:hypothetical protein
LKPAAEYKSVEQRQQGEKMDGHAVQDSNEANEIVSKKPTESNNDEELHTAPEVGGNVEIVDKDVADKSVVESEDSEHPKICLEKADTVKDNSNNDLGNEILTEENLQGISDLLSEQTKKPENIESKNTESKHIVINDEQNDSSTKIPFQSCDESAETMSNKHDKLVKTKRKSSEGRKIKANSSFRIIRVEDESRNLDFDPTGEAETDTNLQLKKTSECITTTAEDQAPKLEKVSAPASQDCFTQMLNNTSGIPPSTEEYQESRSEETLNYKEENRNSMLGKKVKSPMANMEDQTPTIKETSELTPLLTEDIEQNIEITFAPKDGNQSLDKKADSSCNDGKKQDSNLDQLDQKTDFKSIEEPNHNSKLEDNLSHNIGRQNKSIEKTIGFTLNEEVMEDSKMPKNSSLKINNLHSLIPDNTECASEVTLITDFHIGLLQDLKNSSSLNEAGISIPEKDSIQSTVSSSENKNILLKTKGEALEKNSEIIKEKTEKSEKLQRRNSKKFLTPKKCDRLAKGESEISANDTMISSSSPVEIVEGSLLIPTVR